MRSLLTALTVLVLLETVPASASIRITEAHYENGTIIVAGQAPPNQRVTLDGKYNTKADGGGHFEIRAAYKPATCMANITAGEDAYSAIVIGCLLGDAAAAVSPPADATPAAKK